MALADVVNEEQEPASDYFTKETESAFRHRLQELAQRSSAALVSQGFSKDHIRHEMYLNMRHEGTSSALMILKGEASWDFSAEFHKRHQTEFG
ncbi:hypothetical protein KEM52_004730, partial [Ascosphaera acerosa]